MGEIESVWGESVWGDETPVVTKSPISIKYDFREKPELQEKWDKISFNIMNIINYYLTDTDDIMPDPIYDDIIGKLLNK